MSAAVLRCAMLNVPCVVWISLSLFLFLYWAVVRIFFPMEH
jgi:hypothetical protein